jgi:hypothetical protein
VSFWPTTVTEAARRLYAAMIDVHPQLAGRRVEHAWAARIGFTVDRMPHVGRVEGLTYATGCCGTGVAMMPWLGDRAARWALGDAAAPALSELRFPLVPAPYEGRAWFLPMVGEWFRLRDALAARGRDSVPGARSSSEPRPAPAVPPSAGPRSAAGSAAAPSDTDTGGRPVPVPGARTPETDPGPADIGTAGSAADERLDPA